MSLVMEMLASAREDDLEREVRERRLKSALRMCQRRILGIFPVRSGCAADTA